MLSARCGSTVTTAKAGMLAPTCVRLCATTSASSNGGPTYEQNAPKEGAGSSLPTAAKYRAMSVEELTKLLVTRDGQIAKIRAIYEEFHYGVEKKYRKQIFDYHDKAVQFSQVHGQMQSASINMTKEALLRMREQQEIEHRDVKLVYTLCIIFVIGFWVYLRRHYIKLSQLEEVELTSGGNFTERALYEWRPLPKFPSAREKLTWHEQEAVDAKGGLDNKNRTAAEVLKADELQAVRSMRGWGAAPTSPEVEASSSPEGAVKKH